MIPINLKGESLNWTQLLPTGSPRYCFSRLLIESLPIHDADIHLSAAVPGDRKWFVTGLKKDF